MRLFALSLVAALTYGSIASGDPIQVAEVQRTTPVQFDQEILPILRQSCLACHSDSERNGGLVLETPQAMLAGGDSGPALVAGKGAESLLLKLAAHQEESFMPPPDNDVNAPVLKPQELGLIRLWIDQGARGGETATPAAPWKWEPLAGSLGPAYAVAIKPDGRQIAVTLANQLYVYDAASGQRLAQLQDSALDPATAHRDLSKTLAWSSDGTLLASGGYREVKLWRQPHEARLATLPTGSAATAIAVSPDQKWLAIAAADHTIQLWNAATAEPGPKMTGHDKQVTALRFTADGQRLVSASLDGTIRIWLREDGAAVGMLQSPTPVHALELVATAKPSNEQASPPQLIVTGGADKLLRTWKLPETPSPESASDAEPADVATSEIAAHDDTITALVAAPDQPMQVYSGSLDGKIRRWNLTPMKQMAQWDHGAPVLDIDVRADGKRLASVSENHTAKLWDASGKQIAELKGDLLKQRNAARLQRDLQAARQRVTILTQRVAAAEQDLTTRTEAQKTTDEDLQAANEEVAKKKLALDQAQPETPTDKDAATDKAAPADNAEKVDHQQAYRDAEMAQKLAQQKQTAAITATQATQKLLADAKQSVAAAETNVQQLQARLDAANQQAAASERPLRSVRFAPEGKTVVTAGDFPSVQTWDAETGVPIEAFTEQAAALYPLEFLDNQRLISAAGDAEAVIWNLNPQWRLLRTIGSTEQADLISHRVTSLDFNSDVSLLLVGSGAPSRSGELGLFRVADGTQLHHLPKAHTDVVYAAKFSPDGTQFLSAGADKYLRIWDVKTEKLLRQFEGHTDYALGVAWKGDAQTIASASADQTLKVWNVESTDQQRTITGYGKDITALKYVGETDQVISSCGDGTVRLQTSANGKTIRNFAAGIWLHCVDVTADGTLVVACSDDGRLFVWDGASGKQLHAITVGQ
ncbi:c-type cytochrome domain-containing protein [Blastopirellula marina]|uniref:Vegetatible incompatibility protein n=1 Tax=Blastopirellula marina DSM 3645 TaxID=314230 RepID=A3ZUT4_9BACT|nr:c-type cytochrome domain-containing protein [Blastopirellula marina]EAQ79670.1 vegetatible incompatibility protein [Blastopirellula marina DSM 3645]